MQIGDHTFDVATRAVVIGVIDAAATEPVGQAEAMVADGADLLELPPDGVEAVAARVELPIVDPAGDALDPALLATCESAAAAALAVINGRRVIRTHDVRAVRRACDVIAAILEAP